MLQWYKVCASVVAAAGRHSSDEIWYATEARLHQFKWTGIIDTSTLLAASFIRSVKVTLCGMTAVHQSQTFPAGVIYGQLLDITWPYHIPAQHFWSSGLLCCRSSSLELSTGQSPWPGAQQQQFQTIAEDESVLLLPLSTHNAVEMLHDSALYKSIIDFDIDCNIIRLNRCDICYHGMST